MPPMLADKAYTYRRTIVQGFLICKFYDYNRMSVAVQKVTVFCLCGGRRRDYHHSLHGLLPTWCLRKSGLQLSSPELGRLWHNPSETEWGGLLRLALPYRKSHSFLPMPKFCCNALKSTGPNIFAFDNANQTKFHLMSRPHKHTACINIDPPPVLQNILDELLALYADLEGSPQFSRRLVPKFAAAEAFFNLAITTTAHDASGDGDNDNPNRQLTAIFFPVWVLNYVPIPLVAAFCKIKFELQV